MAWVFHTSGSAKATAGANVNSTITADGTNLDHWSSEAESLCCNTARVNLSGSYSTLSACGKEILRSICDAYVAQKIIAYEPAAIGVTEATLRLNVLQNQIETGLNLLKEDKVKTYLGAT